jgi:hypothetical protein
MNVTTWEEARHYAFSPDGRDTCACITDAELGRAIAATGNLLSAAVELREAQGRLIAREDIARRVEASPSLRSVLETASVAAMERALTNGARRRAQKRRARMAVDALDAAMSSVADQALDPAPISVPRASPRVRATMQFYPQRCMVRSTHAAWEPVQAHSRTRRSAVSFTWRHVHRASHPGGQGTYRSGAAGALAAMAAGAGKMTGAIIVGAAVAGALTLGMFAALVTIVVIALDDHDGRHHL